MWLQNSQWDFGCLVVVDMVKTDIQNILYMVVCQGVIDHLAIPAGFHQITQPQSLQLMGDGRFGHAKQSRQIADAHLVQLQSMEDLHPGAVAKHLKQRCQINIFRFFLHPAAGILHGLFMDHIAIAHMLFFQTPHLILIIEQLFNYYQYIRCIAVCQQKNGRLIAAPTYSK